MSLFQDKVAIVTGGTQGIGAAIAANLQKQGAKVVVADLKEGAAPGITWMRHDVTSQASWKKLVADVVAKFGRLDILVNNAGIMAPADVETLTVESFNQHIAVNTQGTFLGCQAAIAQMRALGTKNGSIVNISSASALKTEPWVLAYAASKAAVVSMTQTIALHLARSGTGIRCNAVLPGVVVTPMVQGLANLSPDPAAALKGLEALQPIGRTLTTDETANVVAFLASDLASGMMGAAVVVDGGMTIA